MDTTVANVPARMNGLRRLHPGCERKLSLMAPAMGCTIIPHRGPAIQSSGVADLGIPKESKYAWRELAALVVTYHT